MTLPGGEGIRIQSEDGSRWISPGGLVQVDGVWFGQEREVHRAVGDAEDGVEFRRIHVRLEGEIEKKTFFRVEPDLARTPVALKDVYLGVHGLPPTGSIRVGHFREPFGMERLTPAADLLFLERGFPSALAPGRNVGFEARGSAGSGHLTWAAGIFRETDDQGRLQTDHGGYSTTGRLTALAYDSGEDSYFHLGWAASLRIPPEDVYRVSVPLEAPLSPAYLFPSTLSDLVLLGGAEMALVLGRISLAAEFAHAQNILESRFDGGYSAFHLSTGCFLTGDHRPYDRELGTWGRVHPRGESGAWEITARASAVTANDVNFGAGSWSLYGGTAGLSWFLNDHVRMGCNYGLSHLRDLGQTHTVALRFQVVF